MAGSANALRWDGEPGHYEVYYVSITDRGSGLGLWIRYTMVAPLGAEANCSLWLMAMDPRDPGSNLARKRSWPAAELNARSDPFKLQLAGARLGDDGMSGGFDDVSWDLRWDPAPRPHRHVHPLLEAAHIAQTVLVLPHADLAVTGRVELPGRTLELDGARGGQAHLWGSKHARRWAWVHCNDFETLEGEPRPGAFVDGVSVFVSRFGREIGPNTPVVGSFDGEDFASTGPLRVVRNPSRFGLTTWRFEAVEGRTKIIGEVDAPRSSLVGVTYHDPDGELAYCYNSEVASMRLQRWERPRSGEWSLAETLVAPERAHFEYAQRDPVDGLALQTT